MTVYVLKSLELLFCPISSKTAQLSQGTDPVETTFKEHSVTQVFLGGVRLRMHLEETDAFTPFFFFTSD